ncbi:MAG: EAL domain-containing protein [Saccharofermentans sp.]|nr:EAL domain-containing protein [Saccharofermentans sp.]
MASVCKDYILEHFSEALENGCIFPFFHPIYRTMTGKITCAEALARWSDPQYGLLSPADFITILEDEGLIFDLDMTILEKACKMYSDLKVAGHLLHSFSVNLSRQDFKHEELFDRVNQILASYDVPHESIKLEITESLMLEDLESFKRTFTRFTDAGYTVWIDDFGSGYSSLNMLQNYSFDLLKLDMLFLRDFSEQKKKMIASVINLSKSLGFHTLVEGVEEKEQLEFLRDAGCEAVQGYLLAKPLSGQELSDLFEDQPSLVETLEDKYYWNSIGQLNLLSANPLEEFEGEQDLYASNQVALLEISEESMKHVYVNKSYLDCLVELGYPSLEDLEDAFNNRKSDQYLMLKKMMDEAVGTGMIREIEYINNDVFYRLRAKLLARMKDHAMVALKLSTFDSDREIETAKEMLSYGNALFSTYELVVMFYPDCNTANRIYTTHNLPVYDREATIHISLRKFCEAEVAPMDQERYMRFLDFDTLKDRIKAGKRGFISGFFRMCWGQERYNWYVARVTLLPSAGEFAIMLTIQALQQEESDCVDRLSHEHPEYFV